MSYLGAIVMLLQAGIAVAVNHAMPRGAKAIMLKLSLTRSNFDLGVALYGWLIAFAACALSPLAATAQGVGKQPPTNVIVEPPSDCSNSSIDPASVPPESFSSSPGGVDMRTGQYLYTHEDLSVGDVNGLKLERRFDSVGYARDGVERFGGLSHNWEIFLTQARFKGCMGTSPEKFDYVVSVSAGGRSASFRANDYSPSPGDFVASSRGGYSWLDFIFNVDTNGYQVPDIYTLHLTDGATIVFRSVYSADHCSGGSGFQLVCVYASDVYEPDGTHYTLSYDVKSSPSTAVRLRNVVSNRGYALLFNYAPSGVNSGWVITKACVLPQYRRPACLRLRIDLPSNRSRRLL